MSSAGQAGVKWFKHAVARKTHGHLEKLEHGYFNKSAAILSRVNEVPSTTKVSPKTSNVDEGEVIALKDNFVTTHLPTTCASHILKGFKGSSNSTVANLLHDAGIAVVAKTNMDEFGMGSHSVNSAYGPVRHGPPDHEQSAGGSSGGSALAVAADLVRVAIGSDTGGSVRLPAAYTGIVGFKPSYGRISRHGLIPYANSLDTVGIMSRTVTDAISLYKILNAYDPEDPTCLSHASRVRIEHALLYRAKGQRHDPPLRVVGQRDSEETHKLSGEAKRKYTSFDQWNTTRDPYKIGVPIEYNIEEMHPLVRQAWLRSLSALSDLGHSIVEISLPTTRQALAAYYVLAPAEASSNLAKYDGVRYGMPRSTEQPDNFNGPLYSNYRGGFFGEEVKRRILLGTFTLSAGAMDNYFIQAQKVRRLVQNDFNSVFALRHPLMDTAPLVPDGVDFVVVPTAPTLPPLISEVTKQSPLDSYVNDVFTVPASLAGLPAIGLPAIHSEDLPQTPATNVGIQAIGQFGDDMYLLNFARNVLAKLGPPDSRHNRLWKRSK